MTFTTNRMTWMRHVLGVCLVGVLPLAQALDRGTTSDGVAYVHGGIGDEERLTLALEKTRYSFWLTTAARGSGAYLADVRVRIIDVRTRRPVLEQTLDGPWLFAALPAGNYQVEARHRKTADGTEQTQSGSTTIRAGEHRQMVLYFTIADEWVDRNGPRNTGERSAGQ